MTAMSNEARPLRSDAPYFTYSLPSSRIQKELHTTGSGKDDK